MENNPDWDMLLAGIVALMVIFWFRPGIKASFERARQSEGRWSDVLIPLSLVVLFVIFLIMVS